ncbi:MAG TPA: phosphate ABC transporter permease subunit PstC, partial [Acidimicrobiia bacterium]|nr:phosphate ABC transporter permease subunit PstC [Acidimicrobiia bacterium]
MSDVPSRIDRVFNRVTLAAGLTVLVLLLLVGTFLLLRSRTALSESGLWTFLTREEWRTDVNPPRIGVLGLLTGTVIVATIAVLIAVPFGTMAALFITEYSSPRSRRYLTTIVDLMAAIPSLLFGIWGFLFLSAQVEPLSKWLGKNLGFIPIFATEKGARLTGSMFIAGIVVSLMTLPIIAAVVREVFAQTPPGEKEAALALGSTRWGMIRAVVLPYGRGGIVGGAMLGMGRALGETIAVALLLPQVPEVTFRILENGGATVSGFIALRAGADAFTVSGLMAAGLVLFVLTLGTNMVASVVVSRSR